MGFRWKSGQPAAALRSCRRTGSAAEQPRGPEGRQLLPDARGLAVRRRWMRVASIAPSASVSQVRPAGASVAPEEFAGLLRCGGGDALPAASQPVVDAGAALAAGALLWLLRRGGKLALRISGLSVVRAVAGRRWRPPVGRRAAPERAARDREPEARAPGGAPQDAPDHALDPQARADGGATRVPGCLPTDPGARDFAVGRLRDRLSALDAPGAAAPPTPHI